jgi:tight adherence protein C
VNFALALIAAAGTYLLAQATFLNSGKSLLNRLGGPERGQVLFSTRLLVYREAFRSKLVTRKRLRSAVSELPEILELMAVSLSAGDGLFGALARVTPRANGVLAESLQKVLLALELGADLETELAWLARNLPQRQIVEFTNKLSIALRRGTPLSQMLRSLAESTRSELRNDLLKQAGRNETRMLIPLIFLILPVTVLFAVYPSLQLLNIDYI